MPRGAGVYGSGKRRNNAPDQRENAARLVIEPGQSVVQSGEQVLARLVGLTRRGSRK